MGIPAGGCETGRNLPETHKRTVVRIGEAGAAKFPVEATPHEVQAHEVTNKAVWMPQIHLKSISQVSDISKEWKSRLPGCARDVDRRQSHNE